MQQQPGMKPGLVMGQQPQQQVQMAPVNNYVVQQQVVTEQVIQTGVEKVDEEEIFHAFPANVEGHHWHPTPYTKTTYKIKPQNNNYTEIDNSMLLQFTGAEKNSDTNPFGGGCILEYKDLEYMPFFGFGLQYRVVIPKQIHLTTAKGEKIIGSFEKNAKTSNVREPLGLSTEELTAIRKAEQKALGKDPAKVKNVKHGVAHPADGSFLGTYVFKNGANEVMKIKLSTPALKRLTSAWANLQFHTDQECWYLPPPHTAFQGRSCFNCLTCGCCGRKAKLGYLHPPGQRVAGAIIEANYEQKLPEAPKEIVTMREDFDVPENPNNPKRPCCVRYCNCCIDTINPCCGYLFNKCGWVDEKWKGTCFGCVWCGRKKSQGCCSGGGKINCCCSI